MKLKLTRDNVLVLVTKGDSKTPGGIVLPDSVTDGPNRGVVVEVGPGLNSSGTFVPTNVKKGDKIHFTAGAIVEQIKVDGKDHAIIQESSIIAVIEGE
jgi:chaperonin GroES